MHGIGTQDGRACASVVVSHDIDRMKRVCDRYVMLERGQVRFDGLESAIPDAEPVVGDFFYGASGLSEVSV